MAIFGTENSIEAGQSRVILPRKKQADTDPETRERSVNFNASVSFGPKNTVENASADKVKKQSEPDTVAQQHGLYTTERFRTKHYYSDYQQKTEVMRADPAKISTRLDDRQTIGMMIDLAQARGWDTLKLRGTEDFKREAWVQAETRGMQTEGYKPQQTDKQEAERRKAAAAPAQTKNATEVQKPSEPPKEKPSLTDAEKQANYVRSRQEHVKKVGMWDGVEEAGQAARVKAPAEGQRATSAARATAEVA